MAKENKNIIKETIPVKEDVAPVKEAKKPTPFKHMGRVILITRDGCIVENTSNPNEKISLYGAKYRSLSLGETVEF